MIVSDVPGTTIDAVNTVFEKDNQRYHIIDTAGIQKKANHYDLKNKYSF